MIAQQRVTVSEPCQGGVLVIAYAMTKPASRDVRSPFPPAWPWQVEPELQLLRAFVDIVEGHASLGQRVGPCLECSGGGCETCGGSGQRSHAGDGEAMAAAFETALRRLEAQQEGRLSAADRRRAGQPIYAMTDELRALFGQPDPIRALVGGPDGRGRWRPGLAGMTPSEREAYWLHLHGLSRAAIALSLAPQRRRRFGREGALPLDTVSKYLWRARVKLRKVFALPTESESEYLGELDAEEMAAASQRRDVDPARAQPRPLAAYPLPGEDDFSVLPMPEDEENPEGEPWLP